MFLSKNSQHAVEMPFTADYNHCIVVVFDFFLFFIRSRYGNHKINRFILFDIFFLLLLFVCSHDVRTNFRDHFYKVLSRGLTSKQQKNDFILTSQTQMIIVMMLLMMMIMGLCYRKRKVSVETTNHS